MSMKRTTIIGEAAGIAWLLADAAWAIGDRLNIQNTRMVIWLFAIAILLGVVFVYLRFRDPGGN